MFGSLTLAVALALAAAQPASAASDGAPTRFSEFSVSPDAVDVDHDTVTFTGRLVSSGADGVEQGLPDARVIVSKDYDGLAQATTGPDGRFSAVVKLSTSGDQPKMVEGDTGATYNGDAAHQAAKVSPTVFLHVTPARTRISMAVGPVPEVVGDIAHVTGLLERETPDGGWTAVAGQLVRVLAANTMTKGLTAADGTYDIIVRAPAGEGSWAVSTPLYYSRGPATYGNGPYTGSTADGDPLPVYYRTAITGFNASPEPVGQGAEITAAGRAVRFGVDGEAEPGTGWPVLQFSSDGQVWTDLFSTVPDADGYFSMKTPAERDGYWRVQVERPGVDELPSTSSADYVDVRYRTAVADFNASPEPVTKGAKITVAGTLRRYTTAWKAFSGQSVKIYFAADGTSTWTYEGAATSSTTGHFSHTFTAAKDGIWRVTYAGSADYLAVTGPGDHVDVR